MIGRLIGLWSMDWTLVDCRFFTKVSRESSSGDARHAEATTTTTTTNFHLQQQQQRRLNKCDNIIKSPRNLFKARRLKSISLWGWGLSSHHSTWISEEARSLGVRIPGASTCDPPPPRLPCRPRFLPLLSLLSWVPTSNVNNTTPPSTTSATLQHRWSHPISKGRGLKKATVVATDVGHPNQRQTSPLVTARLREWPRESAGLQVSVPALSQGWRAWSLAPTRAKNLGVLPSLTGSAKGSCLPCGRPQRKHWTRDWRKLSERTKNSSGRSEFWKIKVTSRLESNWGVWVDSGRP